MDDLSLPLRDIIHELNSSIGLIRVRIELIKGKRGDLLEKDEYLASSLEVIETNTAKALSALSKLRELRTSVDAVTEIENILLDVLAMKSLDLSKISLALLQAASHRLDPKGERQVVGTLQLVNERKGELEDFAWVGYRKGLENVHMKIGEGIPGLVAQTGEPILVQDVHDEAWKNIFVAVMASEIRSELVVPLKSDAKVIGVLNVESPIPNAFSSEDQSFLEALAGLAVVAIQNTRRVEWERQRQIDRETVEAQEFQASAYAHRVKNKLGLIPIEIQAIRKLLAKDEFENSKLQRYLDIIEENAKFVSHLTSYFETAVALSPEGVFDVNQLLNEAIHQAKVPSRIDIVTKYDPELPKIKTNRILVEVVVELITNSIKAISGKGTIEIASHKEDEEWIVLSCADSGCGIRPESHDRVFGMFYTDWQPMPDEEVINTGFGLWWVKAVVTKLGGLVAFDSEVNKGTTFYIRLPIKGE